MSAPNIDIAQFYIGFNEPICEMDCGLLCAPFNPNGVPFCCDICHAIPSAYQQEWDYLRPRTDLWHVWRGDECAAEPLEPASLLAETTEHLCLLACKGVAFCEREFRASSCRQFPFFPYITADDRFIGLAYNWDFEDKCWVISHLAQVTETYRQQFIATYDEIFAQWDEEYDSFYYLSDDMRQHFMTIGRRIPILHRNGGYYLLSPKSERLQKVNIESLPKFGVYQNDWGHHAQRGT